MGTKNPFSPAPHAEAWELRAGEARENGANDDPLACDRVSANWRAGAFRARQSLRRLQPSTGLLCLQKIIDRLGQKL